MKKKTLLLITFYVFHATILFSQQLPKIISAGKPVVKPILYNSGITLFTNYNTEQGLALNSIACGYTDKKGNLWFGTLGGGISRYDGKSFTNFSTAQGLANNIVYGILEDKKGVFWFGTSGGGVSRYDGKTFTNLTTAQGLANNTVWSLAQDKKGNIWFGTLGGGVSRYDGKSFTNFTTAHGLANNTVKSITEDKTGNLWFGTEGGGVSRYDGRSFMNLTTEQGLANNIVYSILEDKNGNLWFGSLGGGVSRYDGKSFVNFTTAQGLANNNIYKIAEDKSGNLWFATDGGGVSRYDGKSFTNFTTAQGLANNSVWSITQDKTGHLWFCTFGGGVSRFAGKSLTSFSTEQGLANNIVYSITEDKKGNLWFGTLNGGVSKFDGKTFTNFTTTQGLPNNTIRSIIEDTKGNLWFGTDGRGVSRYDGRSFTNFTTTHGLANNIVFSITEDKKGNLWFGTDGGGVSRYDGETFTNFTTAQGLANDNVWSVLEDKKGNLWFATYGGGVSRFDGKSFTNFTTTQGLANNDVWNITEDKMGNLWFGTSGGGISRYDGNSFISFTTAHGLADDKVYDIIIDRRQNIFIGTNLGFSVLKGFKNPSSNGEPIPAVNDLSNEQIKKFKLIFEIYNRKTGYPIKDVNINAMFCDSREIIWGGCGDNQLVSFDYNAVLKNTDQPAVFINAVKINDENISWYNLIKKIKVTPNSEFDSLSLLNDEILTFGKRLKGAERDSVQQKYRGIKFDSISPFYSLPQNLVLPYSANNITFDFVAIEPARHFLVRYQYMLEGYDKDWSPVTDKTSATFGNIYEGDYTFKLKARNPDGVWSKPITYTFKVLPPWYRTWLAYLLFSILFVAGIWGFIHYRSRSLKKEKLLLEAKVAERTNQLNRSLQELKETQKQLIQSEKMASLGELTAGIAHEIQNPLNFVNNFSEVNTELIAEMEEEIDMKNFDAVKPLAKNVKENEEKIIFHGRRADAIVKSMLLHSRTGTGKKELTDINALAGEYIRLAYHGLRAKDPGFNAEFETHLDPQIGKLDIVPQDIGRVLLNLLNNAFYAVGEKGKLEEHAYQPTVIIKTWREESKVMISVKDNGYGIPAHLIDKIFQPFFTTKATGEGAGLGLSLSYDIVKAHGGELKVETKDGEGSTFIIQLPV